MPQEEQFPSQGWEVAAFVVEDCRIDEHAFLTTQVSAKLPHRLVVQPEPEGVDDVHLLHGLVLVCICKADTVVVADIGLIGIGGHLLNLRMIGTKVQ